jgi:hypothetical protein
MSHLVLELAVNVHICSTFTDVAFTLLLTIILLLQGSESISTSLRVH